MVAFGADIPWESNEVLRAPCSRTPPSLHVSAEQALPVRRKGHQNGHVKHTPPNPPTARAAVPSPVLREGSHSGGHRLGNFRPRKLCHHFVKGGWCRRGSECTFAHGIEELHPDSRTEELQKLGFADPSQATAAALAAQVPSRHIGQPEARSSCVLRPQEGGPHNNTTTPSSPPPPVQRVQPVQSYSATPVQPYGSRGSVTHLQNVVEEQHFDRDSPVFLPSQAIKTCPSRRPAPPPLMLESSSEELLTLSTGAPLMSPMSVPLPVPLPSPMARAANGYIPSNLSAGNMPSTPTAQGQAVSVKTMPSLPPQNTQFFPQGRCSIPQGLTPTSTQLFLTSSSVANAALLSPVGASTPKGRLSCSSHGGGSPKARPSLNGTSATPRVQGSFSSQGKFSFFQSPGQ